MDNINNNNNNNISNNDNNNNILKKRKGTKDGKPINLGTDKLQTGITPNSFYFIIEKILNGGFKEKNKIQDPCPSNYIINALDNDFKFENFVYINPPFSKSKFFWLKSVEEFKKNNECKIILLIPHNHNADYFADNIYNQQEYVKIFEIHGKIKFVGYNANAPLNLCLVMINWKKFHYFKEVNNRILKFVEDKNNRLLVNYLNFLYLKVLNRKDFSDFFISTKCNDDNNKNYKIELNINKIIEKTNIRTTNLKSENNMLKKISIIKNYGTNLKEYSTYIENLKSDEDYKYLKQFVFVFPKKIEVLNSNRKRSIHLNSFQKILSLFNIEEEFFSKFLMTTFLILSLKKYFQFEEEEEEEEKELNKETILKLNKFEFNKKIKMKSVHKLLKLFKKKKDSFQFCSTWFSSFKEFEELEIIYGIVMNFYNEEYRSLLEFIMYFYAIKHYEFTLKKLKNEIFFDWFSGKYQMCFK